MEKVIIHEDLTKEKKQENVLFHWVYSYRGIFPPKIVSDCKVSFSIFEWSWHFEIRKNDSWKNWWRIRGSHSWMWIFFVLIFSLVCLFIWL